MQPTISDEEIIRFGEFELALKSGELRRNGNVVRLQPQPFKVLAILAAHAGQTVTRQELQEAVWAGETFVDFEHGLNFCIKQIRSALGDNAQSPRLIETLPRRGYRFIGDVERLNTNSARVNVDREAALEAPTPVRKSSQNRIAVIGLVVAVIAIVTYAGWRALNRKPVPVAVPPSKLMMAVLPFENLSGDADQDYFSDGMTEEMIARLSRLQPQSLGVIARTSVMTYKKANTDIAQIGRELGVNFVTEASIRRVNDGIRITVQLIPVSDQTHLWSESYDRSPNDVLSVQSEVAGEIARALAIELLGDREHEPRHSPDPEAVDAYLRGRYLWNKAGRDSVRRSVDYFNRAIEKDQDYAAAFAGLADSYRLLGMYFVIPPSESYPKAKEAALRAIELDPANADAHVALGSIKFRFEWEWKEAESNFLRAIELNPNLGMAHHDYAWFLIAMKRFDEGIEHMKLEQRLDPLSPVANSDVGWAYLMARRYDEAIEQIERTLDLEPGFGGALACLERAYTLQGRHREALETLLKEIGDTNAGAGDEDAARSMKALYRTRVEKRLELVKKEPASPYSLATICISAGE